MCENNGYGEFTPQANHQAIVDVADRAAGYGMPGVVVDGMDAIAVYEAAGEAIERARKGAGPTLLECKTYRFYDHVGIRGMGLTYRTDDEVRQWMHARSDHAVRSASRRTRRADEEESRGRARGSAAAGQGRHQVRRRHVPFPDAASLLDDVYATGS